MEETKDALSLNDNLRIHTHFFNITFGAFSAFDIIIIRVIGIEASRKWGDMQRDMQQSSPAGLKTGSLQVCGMWCRHLDVRCSTHTVLYAG